MGTVPNKIKAMGMGLEEWFRGIKKKKLITKKELEKQLLQLNDEVPTDEILGDIVETKLHINMEADKEELYWEQRA